MYILEYNGIITELKLDVYKTQLQKFGITFKVSNYIDILMFNSSV